MSDFYNKYPYTDFHELNLDWIIERVKQLTADWIETKQAWENTETDWQELYDYVHDYFDNLNVQTEINNKIDAMILDGTFQQIATPIIQAKVETDLPGVVSQQIGGTVAGQIGSTVAGQLPNVVSDQIGDAVVTPVSTWLNDHITQPTSPAIDDTLTIRNAAADSQSAGNMIFGGLVKEYEGLTQSNSQTLSISYSSPYRQYSRANISSGRKLLLSAKITTDRDCNIKMGVINPNTSSWINSDIVDADFETSTPGILTATYTTTDICYVAFNTTEPITVTGTIELYVYDISNTTIDDYIDTSVFYNKGYAYRSHVSNLSMLSEKATKMTTLSLTADRNVTHAAAYFCETGFSQWQYNHEYIFILDNDTGIASDTQVVGFQNSGHTWAGIYGFTEKFADGSGYVRCTPPASAQINWSSYFIMNNTDALSINLKVFDITGLNLSKSMCDMLAQAGTSADVFDIIRASEEAVTNYLINTWKNKNVLFIGDSLTAANKYQYTVKNRLGINFVNHAKGGLGIVSIIDGDGDLGALSVADVTGKDLIVFYAGYNDRATPEGDVGDLYPGDNTICGMMQYAINTIYSLLASAGNLTCKILIVSLDCAGKYPWIDADGYDEYPAASGQSMQTIAAKQVAVAHANSLPCVDLWNDSGINKNTWTVFGAESSAVVDPSTHPGTPYPSNGDQLHKSNAGYQRIGECITGAILDYYSN